ncbi:MAG: RNA polymerase, partial [Prevotella sp.]|nr:RNA polymerase [Prevotella sp.]
DVVSDIFARLLRDGDRPQKDRMEGYLMTAVRNRCRDVLNRKSMQEWVEKHFLQDSMQISGDGFSDHTLLLIF